MSAGCPRVAGDEEESFDADDFDDEFQIKTHQDDSADRLHVTNNSVIFHLFFFQENIYI